MSRATNLPHFKTDGITALNSKRFNGKVNFKLFFTGLLLVFLCMGFAVAEDGGSHPFGWDDISTTARPATFWWWLGSSVNETEIARQMEMLKEAGFGTVMICPLYEYDNPTIPAIEYLSDRWVEVFKFTMTKGKELDMLVDTTTGAGWPMGGPWISKDNGERDWRLEIVPFNVTEDDPIILRNEQGKDPIACVTLLEDSYRFNFEVYENPNAAKIIEPVTDDGQLVWKLP